MTRKCPKCGGVLTHDEFEDDYNCFRCNLFFYPEQIGVSANPDAGYLKLSPEQRTGDETL